MKFAITVSQVTPGGGLSKYVCTLTEILASEPNNEVWVISTHATEQNPNLEKLKEKYKVDIVRLDRLATIRKYATLITILHRIKPDILIVNYNATTQYVLPFLPKKIKTIHILHNNTPDFYRVASINAKLTDAWIAPTPAVGRYFDEYTHQKYSNRIAVIPHGVDTPACEPIKDPNMLQLTYVGVLDEHKGVKILPAIIKRLLSEGRKFHFTFIGEGILRLELEQELRTEIESGIVEFTGSISGNEVYERLSCSDIFVYPTHIDAFGLVIAEAMINGAVPVVTLLDGITDSIIENGKEGYLVLQDDVDGFVGNIGKLMDNSEHRSQLSKAALKKAKACFSKEVMRKNYINFFERLATI